jgi:hypothetical protein
MYLLGHTDAKLTLSVDQQVLDMSGDAVGPSSRFSAGTSTTSVNCSTAGLAAGGGRPSRPTRSSTLSMASWTVSAELRPPAIRLARSGDLRATIRGGRGTRVRTTAIPARSVRARG